MNVGFNVESVCLSAFLKAPRVLDLPEFQREYAWSTVEAGQLLDDLLVAFSQAQREPYFLGVLLLLEPCKSVGRDPPPATLIIDGQQRLTTLTILLCVLRDLCRSKHVEPPGALQQMIVCRASDGEQPRFRLALHGPAGAFLAAHVQMTDALWRTPQIEGLSPSQGRILDARDFMAGVLADRDAEELAAFARFVAKRTYAAVLKTRDADHAHRAYTVINTRGVPLQRSDIIKAELLGPLDPVERAAVMDQWDIAYAAAGGDMETLLGAIRTIEGKGRSPIVAGIREVVEATGGPQAFIETMLVPYARVLEVLRTGRHSGSRHSPGIVKTLRHLNWLGSKEWLTPALLFWRRHADEPERLYGFLSALDRLLVSLRVLGLGADRRETRLNAVLAWVRTSDGDDVEGGPLALTRDEQRTLFHHLKTPHRRSPAVCRQILLRINDALDQDRHAPIDPDAWTVDHWLPQNPGRESTWCKWFPDLKVRESCTHSLGNLVLVGSALNNRARNKDLQQKLPLFETLSIADLPAITRQVCSRTTWHPEDVTARERQLLEILANAWRLPMTHAPSPSASTSTQAAAARARGQSRAVDVAARD